MVYYIEFILSNLIFDFSATLIYKKTFNLKAKNIYLFFLQILTVTASVLYLFCFKNIVIFLLLKFLFMIVIILLTADNYSIKNLLVKSIVFESLIFVVVGTYVFLGVFYHSIILDIFNQKIAKIFKHFKNLVIFLQYIAIYCSVNYLNQKKKIQNLLAKIEFYLLGEHIKLIGLIDSGNCLYDSKTKLPIVVVDLLTLKKHVSKLNYDLITILISKARKEECYVANGYVFKIPILEVDNAWIADAQEKRKIKFMIGVIEKSIYDVSKFECLIHRDFI